MRGILLFLAITVFATGPTRANPDIWVTAKFLYHFGEDRLDGLTIEWEFDDFFSDRTILKYDRNGDGLFSEDEMRRLRKELFDPLGSKNFYLHILQNDKRQPFAVESFEPRIDEGRLVFRFSTLFAEPLRYDSDAVSVSLHDAEVIFDFTAAEDDFLLVEGPYNSACKFRVEQGSGALKGHKNTIALLCGE